MNAEVSVSRWYDNAAVVERGPLVYALRMEENWTKHKCEGKEIDKWGAYYYEVTSPTEWNYALNNKDIAPENVKNSFIVEKKEISDIPWTLANAPIQIKCKGIKLDEWKMSRNSTGSINYFTQMLNQQELGEEKEITLIPYGCTTLRIAEFPVRRK